MGIDEADGLERVDSEYMLYSVDEGEYKRIIKGLEPGGYIISVSAYTVAYDVETGNTEEDYVIDDMVYYEIFDEDGTISISVTYGENGLNIEELGADKQFYLRDYMNDVLQSEDLITSWLSFSDTNLYGAVYMCYYSYVDERFEVCDSEGNVIDTFVPDFSNVGEEGLLELWVVVDEKTGEAVISAREYPAEITHDTYLKVVVYDENGKEAASDCLKCLGNIEECHRALLKDVEPGEYTVVTYGYSIAEGDYVYISSGIYNLAGDVLVVSDAGGDSLEVLQGGELNKAFYVNIYKNGDNFRSSSWLRYDDKDNSFYHAELFRSGEYTIYVFDCEDDLVAQKTVDFGDGKADSLSDVDVMFDFDTQEITVSENYLPEDININNYVKVIVTQNGSQIVNEYMPVQDDDDYIFSRVINGLSEGKYVVSVLAYSDDYDGYYVEAVKSVDVTEGNALVVTYFDDLTVEQVEASNVTTPDDSTSSDDTQNNGNGTSNNTQSSGSNTSSGSNQSSKVTAPKTGDSLNVELYILMLMVSGSFAAALCYRRKLNK
jgi:hypothetical protein